MNDLVADKVGETFVKNVAAKAARGLIEQIKALYPDLAPSFPASFPQAVYSFIYSDFARSLNDSEWRVLVKKPNLTTREASDYLMKNWGISRKPATMTKARSVGDNGPRYFKAGYGVLYSRRALDEFAKNLLSTPRQSTSG